MHVCTVQVPIRMAADMALHAHQALATVSMEEEGFCVQAGATSVDLEPAAAVSLWLCLHMQR